MAGNLPRRNERVHARDGERVADANDPGALAGGAVSGGGSSTGSGTLRSPRWSPRSLYRRSNDSEGEGLGENTSAGSTQTVGDCGWSSHLRTWLLSLLSLHLYASSSNGTPMTKVPGIASPCSILAVTTPLENGLWRCLSTGHGCASHVMKRVQPGQLDRSGQSGRPSPRMSRDL
jgi:hypothetical protein